MLSSEDQTHLEEIEHTLTDVASKVTRELNWLTDKVRLLSKKCDDQQKLIEALQTNHKSNFAEP